MSTGCNLFMKIEDNIKYRISNSDRGSYYTYSYDKNTVYLYSDGNISVMSHILLSTMQYWLDTGQIEKIQPKKKKIYTHGM